MINFTINKGEIHMKMSISIPDELNEELEKYCEQTGMKKSTTIQLALTEYFQAKRIMADMPTVLEELSSLIRKQGKQVES